MEKMDLEKEKKIEEDNNIEKKTENFGNKFAKKCTYANNSTNTCKSFRTYI